MIVYANPLEVKPRENYTLQSEDESECFANSETDGDDEIQCTICGVGIPADKEQEHINANHSSEDESTAPKVREERIRPQRKKKKAKMYKSSQDSESEDNEMVNHEVKKISRGVSINADAINDLSTSVMKLINEVKSDQKLLIVTWTVLQILH